MSTMRSAARAIGAGSLIVIAVVGLLAILFLALIFGPRALDSVRARPVEAGCDTKPQGPGALVAFDASSGDREWLHFVGHADVAAVENGTIELVSDLSAEISPELVAVRRSFDLVAHEVTDCTEAPVAAAVEEAAAAVRRPFELAFDFDHVDAGLTLRITNERHQSTIDAFEFDSGAARWSAVVPVDGSSARAAVGSATTIVAATDTEVSLLDAATGAIVWTADHGSPGEGGFFDYHNKPGGYQQFWYDADLDQYIGIIRATAPYRD